MFSLRAQLCQHQSVKFVKRNQTILRLILFIIISFFIYTQFGSIHDYLINLSISNLLTNDDNNKYYKISLANKINGAIINGIDLCDINNINKAIINELNNDLYKYEFLILKNQCYNNNESLYKIPSDKFTLIASKFGIISEYGSGHPATPPNTNITVLSNDKEKGKTTTGAKGWHIDGTSEYKPNSICFQHIRSVPNNGNGGTQLISSKYLLKLIKKININLYNKLNGLYMIAKGHYIHPVIAIHPITNNEYFIIHTAYTQQFIQIIDINNIKYIEQEINGKYVNKQFIDKYINDKRFKFYTKEETIKLLDVIISFIEHEARENELIYITKYEKGDLLIRDNLGLIHKSHPSAQQSPDEVGLRVLWRLTLQGKYLPSKFPVVT